MLITNDLLFVFCFCFAGCKFQINLLKSRQKHYGQERSLDKHPTPFCLVIFFLYDFMKARKPL